MRINIRLIPLDIISQYQLNVIVNQYGWVNMEIIRGMHGLPQSGILAINLLAQRLHNHRYYQVKQIPGLLQHLWRPISFTLVVEDFVIGCLGLEHADTVMSALKIYYEKI